MHEFYGDTQKDYDELADDNAKAFHGLIMALYEAGCRNVQLDDCTWGMFCDPNFNQHYTADEFAAMQEQYAAMNNAAIEDLPEDLVITTHDCRGNYHSTWASAGGIRHCGPTCFSARKTSPPTTWSSTMIVPGDFEPLAKVSGDKKVVLGLITSKKPELEDPEVIRLALPRRPVCAA